MKTILDRSKTAPSQLVALAAIALGTTFIGCGAEETPVLKRDPTIEAAREANSSEFEPAEEVEGDRTPSDEL